MLTFPAAIIEGGAVRDVVQSDAAFTGPNGTKHAAGWAVWSVADFAALCPGWEVLPVLREPPETGPNEIAVEQPQDAWSVGDDVVSVTYTVGPAPPEPVPQIVSRFQARAAMLSSPATSPDFDNLLAQINAVVDASGDDFAKLAWAEAVEWNRASPTVNALAAAVGVTGDQLDDLFRAAAGIVA